MSDRLILVSLSSEAFVVHRDQDQAGGGEGTQNIREGDGRRSGWQRSR